MGLHLNPGISLCHPPTHSKVTSLQYNFPFIGSCMEFKLQLLCTPGATVIHCQTQPAALDLLLNTAAVGWGVGQPHLPLLPTPLFPRITPKPRSTSLSHSAERIVCNNPNSRLLNIKYPVLKRLLATPLKFIDKEIRTDHLQYARYSDKLGGYTGQGIKLQITEIIPASLKRE